MADGCHLVGKGLESFHNVQVQFYHDGVLDFGLEPDSKAMHLISFFSKLHLTDIVGVIACHDLVERGTALLYLGHLDGRILKPIEEGSPVGEEHEVPIASMGHVDDDIFARGHLEDGLYAILSEAKGVMRCLLMECGAGSGGVDFAHGWKSDMGGGS